jgi:hypothetical protein
MNPLLDPTNCPLHIQKITGRMSFTMDEDGNYPAHAPACSCILGIQEAIVKKEENRFQKVLNERNAMVEKRTGISCKEKIALIKYKEMFPLEYNSYEEEFKRLSKDYPEDFAKMKAQ